MNTLATTTDRDKSGRASQESPTSTVKSVSELAGRVLLSVLFLLSGLGKIGAYAATAAYMSSRGVPGALLPVVLVTEVVGALAIILGWQTRIIAFLLAGYTLLAAPVTGDSSFTWRGDDRGSAGRRRSPPATGTHRRSRRS